MKKHEITKLVEEMGGWGNVSDEFAEQAKKVIELEKQTNFEMDVLKVMSGKYAQTFFGPVRL